MELYEIILIAIALSMDACALTIANCSTYKNSFTRKKEWAMPITFAVFQGIMPLIGFCIGSLFSGVISIITDFLTAIIFFALSAKIIFDIVKDMKEEKVISSTNSCNKTINFTFLILIIQALATSIDALAIGVTLVNLTFSIFIAVGVIAVVTFVLVSLSLAFGKSLGKWFGRYAEWFGAGILLLLAIKSLIEALM